MKIQGRRVVLCRDFTSQEVHTLLNNDENENDLFKTDVKLFFINLNEKYKVRNKYKAYANSAQDPDEEYIDKKIK